MLSPHPIADPAAAHAPEASEPAGSPPALDALRATIRSIERRPPSLSGPNQGRQTANRGSPESASTWTLGESAFDDVIGVDGLSPAGMHELKPAADMPLAGARASAIRFTLALAVRRLMSLDRSRQDAPVLLCATSAHCAEAGAAYAPGLSALGIDPVRLILVEAPRQADVLWAVEEGLKAGGLALVLGWIDDIALTPARRLALAAEASTTPCLLLSHPRSPPAAATATRWRIAPAPSAPHPFDPQASGAPRFRVALERCRGSTVQASSVSYLLEWCDAAYRFGVVAGLADEPARSRTAQGPPSPHLDRRRWA